MSVGASTLTVAMRDARERQTRDALLLRLSTLQFRVPNHVPNSADLTAPNAIPQTRNPCKQA